MNTNTIATVLAKAGKSLKRYSKPAMKVVLFYLFFVILLLFTWYGAWVYQFNRTSTPDLDALSKFIVIVLGATAFFGFIISCFVDKNHNGIPDAFENTKPPPPQRSTNESNRHI